jgi:NosR/NirI family transcriptional regulator, nitrous oxide reductase regulator
MRNLTTSRLARFFLVLTLVALALPAGAVWERYFPEADRIGEPTGEPPARAVYRGEERVGLVFETNDVAPIPAYSGEPVNMLVGLDATGMITGVQVLEHSEPIMLVGIPEQRLVDFANQYLTRTIKDRVRVGISPRQREGYQYVDAVSGATVTVVVMGEASCAAPGASPWPTDWSTPPHWRSRPATVREDVFEPANWDRPHETGGVARLDLTRGEVDEAFIGTEAEGRETAPPGAEGETFIDLYAAYLNAPTVGRNLLGDTHYERSWQRLERGRACHHAHGRGALFLQGIRIRARRHL